MNLEEKRRFVEENIKHLPLDEEQSYKFNFACVFTKNSVGMESGHTARLEEVVSTIRGKNPPIDEKLKRDDYTHYKAYLQVVDYVSIREDDHLSEDTVKNIHQTLTSGVFEGGIYRNVNIYINDSKYIPCDYIKVYERMRKYIDELNKMPSSIDKACYAHLYLHKVHPFLDGNGRLCRLILNMMLLEAGYLPVSIPAKRRDEYFNTLEEYKVNKNSEPFKAFLMDLLDKEYDRFIDLIQPHVK